MLAAHSRTVITWDLNTATPRMQLLLVAHYIDATIPSSFGYKISLLPLNLTGKSLPQKQHLVTYVGDRQHCGHWHKQSDKSAISTSSCLSTSLLIRKVINFAAGQANMFSRTYYVFVLKNERDFQRQTSTTGTNSHEMQKFHIFLVN